MFLLNGARKKFLLHCVRTAKTIEDTIIGALKLTKLFSNYYVDLFCRYLEADYAQ